MESLGEVDIGNLQVLIDNYEFLIQDLTNGIQIFQIEYSDLSEKVKNVVVENDKLSREITNYISKEQQNQSGDSNKPQIIENLKMQLNLISTEKDYAMQLWRNAITMIDNLEEELKTYQEVNKNSIPRSEAIRLKNECEGKIKSLQDELALTRAALSKNDFFNIEKSRSDFLTKEDSSTKIIKNLEEEILALQQRLSQSNQVKEELSKTINKQNKKIKSLEDRNKEYVTKVNEAVQVVEAACIEKDFALMRELESKDEMSKVSKSLLEAIENAELKLKSEVDQVKSDFNTNLKTVLDDLKKAHSDSVVKQNEINTYAKQCALLENEIERLQTKRGRTEEEEDGNSKLLILEKNLEKTFQKLLTSEKENIILNAETSRLRADMNDMIRNFENDIKSREIEKTRLNNKIAQMKQERVDGDKKYFELLEELEGMRSKLLEMKRGFKEEMEQKQNEIRLSHSEEINLIRRENETSLKELEDQLESQIELNRRWRSETKIIVAKLEGQIRRQRDIVKRLHRVVWNLKRKLKGKRKDKKIQPDLTVLTDASQIETKPRRTGDT
ncbi:desmoplakin-like [Coccinella septempunctata]|uniref:desmoplakin-like n=1 Tax=Coccinella septempunctata TaxID=41139 RepID=UPI001D076395|nr:desmoplakin-like [Coccinella septempunctata]